VRKGLVALAVIYLAAHLASLPPTLEDSDSVNFALGVRDFDIERHQPHPPGYPVFIALGKVGTSALRAVGVAAPEVRGLAIWSAIGGAVLVLLAFAFFRAIGASERHAACAAILAAVAPLSWFTAVRPMSDVAGLAVALGALAMLGSDLDFFTGPGRKNQDLTPVGTALAALFAGIAIGFRVQMAILTLPLLAFVLLTRRGRGAGRAGLVTLAALAAGIAIWALPLVITSGGPAAYVRALGTQAGEDLTGVVMLWTHPTPRVAATAILDTFVRPWDSPVLAGVVLVLAAAGFVLLARKSPRTLLLVAVAFGPYAVFHLLFQEPLTIRYALPLLLPVAFLASTVLAEADPRAGAAALLALSVAGLACALPAMTAFANVPNPIFSLLQEGKLLEGRGANPVVQMHRRVFTESRPARVWAGQLPGTLLPSPRDYEWLEVTRAWREGHEGETWFLAEPRRTDLALVDPAHRRVRRYRWPFRASMYLGGTRPGEIDWHVTTQPGWFLERGWALTPEVAGITERDGWGPHRQPSLGWIRRRDVKTMMMIGGRHLGSSSDPSTRLVASLDDRPAATLDLRPGFFLTFTSVAPEILAGNGRYAKLTVRAESAQGPASPVAIEQFDLQPADAVLFGFDAGWHEPEYDPRIGKTWRWMSERAVVSVHHAGRNVTLRLQGESPLHYFSDPPLVRISVGDRVLAELRPDADFTADVAVPADALSAAGGRIVLTSDRTYVPGEREGTADRRRLALRIFSLTVD
jgi:hypothetical protein